MKRLVVLVPLLGLAACQTNPPLQEYTLARTALESARKIESVRVAPAFFHRAEEAFRKAEIQYKREDYSEAKDSFITAKEYAEKAENAARIQKTDGG